MKKSRKKKRPSPAGFVAESAHFLSSLAVLRQHSDFDFHCLTESPPASGLRYVLTTQHLRVVFVQASTEKQVSAIGEMLRDCTTSDTPPVVLIALPEIALPHADLLKAQTAFAGLLPLPFDVDVMAAQFELLRQTLTKRFFEMWVYQNAVQGTSEAFNQTSGGDAFDEASQRLVISSPHGDRHIPIGDILCCVAQNTYTEVWYCTYTPMPESAKELQSVSTFQELLHGDNLHAWEEKLPKSDFMRVHRSALVNMKAIKRVERHHTRKGLVLTLLDGREVKVARDKTQLFLKRHSGKVIVTEDGEHIRMEWVEPSSEAGQRGGGRKYPVIATKKLPSSQKTTGSRGTGNKGGEKSQNNSK